MKKQAYILYIEDERPTLDLVCQVLKLSGYHVSGVTSGYLGLELMRQQKPDIVLLDLMMPEMSGGEVFRVMKEDAALADIPVIAVTAKIPKRDRVIVDGLPPVDDYITKPFEVKTLLRALWNLLPPASLPESGTGGRIEGRLQSSLD